MSHARRVGTAAETAVVRYLQASGWPSAERRAGSGIIDRGDIAGVAGVVVEVKSRAGAFDLSGWLDETETERVNAGAGHGVLVVRRRQRATHDWYAITTLGAHTRLLCDAGYGGGHGGRYSGPESWMTARSVALWATERLIATYATHEGRPPSPQETAQAVASAISSVGDIRWDDAALQRLRKCCDIDDDE